MLCPQCGHRDDGVSACPTLNAMCPIPPPRHGLKLAMLVLELAEAVDNAAHDIGGSRPQLTILREAVVEAHRIKAAA